MHPAYDLTPAEAEEYIRGSEPWPLRKVVKDLVGNSRVLEVGCANGIQAARFHPARYTGVDWSSPLLNEARRRLPEHRFIEADALRLPFADNSFETACAVSLLEHLSGVSEARRCISEMLRVAGRAIIGWHTPPTDRPTQCRWVVGHFGRWCWSNRYRTADLVGRVTIHAVPATDGSLVWEI